MDVIRFPYESEMTPEHKASLTRLMNREDFRRLADQRGFP